MHHLPDASDTTLQLTADALPAVLVVYDAPGGLHTSNHRTYRKFVVTEPEVTIRGTYSQVADWELSPSYPKQWVLDSMSHPHSQEQLYTLLREHPEVPEAIDGLYWTTFRGLDHEVAREIFERYSDESRRSWYGRKLEAILYPNAQRTVSLHHPFLDFEAVDAEGQMHRLSDFVGEKYVLLDFGSMGCGGCVLGVPTLAKIDSLYGDQIEVINVWTAPDRERWQRSVHQKWDGPITWQDWWDVSEQGFVEYDISRYPTFFIIDPDGLVKYSSAESVYNYSLLQAVEKLLVPPPPPTSIVVPAALRGE